MSQGKSTGRCTFRGAVLGLLLLISGQVAIAADEVADAPPQRSSRPNIVFINADNLGWGELGVYGGGILRGAPTPRIDNLASEGLRLLNFNTEPSCIPSRASLMTGRFSVRTGAFGEAAERNSGLVNWEVTIAELLSSQGYSTAIYGKWHSGDQPGRFPTDQGFDEWYGLGESASVFRGQPGYDPEVTPPDYVLEARRGGNVARVKELDIPAREELDTEITDRSIDYIRRNAHQRNPFFLYIPLTQIHYPVLPSKAFRDRTGNGTFADSVVEMDHHVGQILDTIEEAGISDNTIVIFTSDNGPDNRYTEWRGNPGYWRGYMRTTLEGSLRAPFIIRWRGKIPAAVSNEIVHAVDMLPTLARIAGAPLPHDRAIDGVDQLDFFLGNQDASNREGFPIFWRGEPYAVKWRNWKLHFIWRPEYFESGPIKPISPYLFNLLSDPREEIPLSLDKEGRWLRNTMRGIMTDFTKSLEACPPIPPRTADPYTPPPSARCAK